MCVIGSFYQQSMTNKPFRKLATRSGLKMDGNLPPSTIGSVCIADAHVAALVKCVNVTGVCRVILFCVLRVENVQYSSKHNVKLALDKQNRSLWGSSYILRIKFSLLIIITYPRFTTAFVHIVKSVSPFY